MQPISNLKTSNSGNQPPTKYIVLKSSPGAGPVVTKVIKAPVCTPASGVNVTVAKSPLNGGGGSQNAAQSEASPVSTRATVARKAYERCGTADFLRRVTGGVVAGKMKVSSSNEIAKAPAEVSPTGVNKKHSPPKQINIFSALDDDIFAPPQPKKTSPGASAAKKPMTTRIELSCTYQPAAKPAAKSPLIVRPAEMANILSPERKSPQQQKQQIQQQQNQQQSLLEKLSNKDDWLLEFSGSPTKCPSKPGGSVVDNNSSEDEDHGSSSNRRSSREDASAERTDSVQPFTTKHHARSVGNNQDVEVVNLDSSCEVIDVEGVKNEVINRNENNAEDEDYDVEIEDPNEVEKSSVNSRDSKEKDLSFVEARSRRKRKPPTYFGYEDHELSYNLGLNPVFTPEELEAQGAAKKKRSSSAHSDAHSTTSSTSSGSRGRRGGSAGSRRGRPKQTSRSRDDEALSDSDRELADFNEDDENNEHDKQRQPDYGDEQDDEEEEDSKSLGSSFSSIRSLKSQEKSEDLFADSSSDEEPLTSVAQKEKPKPTETVETVDIRSDDTDSSASFSSPIKDKETTEIEQTAFRLYYKENLLKIERKNPHLKTPDEILGKVSELWCKLWKNEREAYLEQARELTQITLQPKLHKGKKGSSERSTRDHSGSRKSASSESHKRRKELKEKPKNSTDSVFARLAAELDSNSSDADSITTSKDTKKETPMEHDSPVKSVKKKMKRVKIESSTSSSDDDSSSSSSESSIDLSKDDPKTQKKQLQKQRPEEGHKPPKKEVQIPPAPKICFNCPKEAITSHLWCSDGQYCSISCCVLYSKKCFNDWVAERKRKAEIKREQNEIEAYKHAKDFFCIETEDDETNDFEPRVDRKNSDNSETFKHETPPFSPPSEAKLE